ncbi:hypothetical protein MY10362_006150 [Beauveria mimosiformis]
MDETDIDRCCTNESLIAQRRVMDKNVILRLYAYPRGDHDANMTIRHGGTYWPPRRVTQSINYNDCHQDEQRWLDETPSDSDAEQVYDDQPYFEFRFDTVRSHTEGFILGTDQKCDVRLPDGLKLSRKHVCITFDDKRRLVVEDLASTNGTAVSYSDMIPDRRRNFTWIIGGINQVHEKDIVIYMGIRLRLKFRAFVNYDIFADDGSASLIDQFRSQMMANEDISAMKSTPTPIPAPSFLHCIVDKGTFGQVTLHLDINTGDSYVVKTPLSEDYEPQKWENEVRIMIRLGKHENIVPLLKFDEFPLWRIYLPYYRLGNLRTLWYNQKPGPFRHEFRLSHVIELLKQCLAGLKHAHANGVAHRDLKLANILVESLTPFKIRLADFGESKDTAMEEPKTYCGTEPYMAPEVLENKSENPGCYSIACDLWSLGAVLSEILFGRPRWPRSRDMDRAYCDAILTQTRQPCEADLQHLQRFLLQNLLITDPEKRRTAADCYELAMALPPVDEPSPIMNSYWRLFR